MGDCDSEGNGNGIGVGVQNIFGEKGAVIGKWKDGRWEGECLEWSGRTGTSTTERNGVEYQGEYFYDTIYTGQWTHGAPEGVIEVKETRYSIYQGHEEYNSESRKEGEIVFKDGKAEGRTALTEYYYSDYRQEWKESSQEIHEFKEGKPQPFIVKTEKGEKTAYEAKVDPKSKGVAYDYTETPCSCQYVW